MHRLSTLALLGITGISMANPQESQAQTSVIQVQTGTPTVVYQQVRPYLVDGYVVYSQPVLVTQPVLPTVVVSSPSVVVAPSIYVDWRWDGYRWHRPVRWIRR